MTNEEFGPIRIRITNIADRSVNEVLKLALNALVRGETALRWEAIAAIKEVLLEEKIMNDTWRKKVEKELNAFREAWGDVVSNTMSDAEIDTPFDSGYGSNEGCPFTIWTSKRVYFPVTYDGSEWVGSVARYPDGKPTDHIGA